MRIKCIGITHEYQLFHNVHQFITFKSLALHQIQVVSLLQDATFEATAQSLQIATVNVEHKTHRDYRVMLAIIAVEPRKYPILLCVRGEKCICTEKLSCRLPGLNTQRRQSVI